MPGPTSTATRTRGLSLAEMLVTLGMFSVLLTLVVALTVMGYRASQKNDYHTAAFRMCMLGMEHLKKELRAAQVTWVDSAHLYYKLPEFDGAGQLRVSVNPPGYPIWDPPAYGAYVITVDSITNPRDHWLIKQQVVNQYAAINGAEVPTLLRRLVDLGNNGSFTVGVPPLQPVPAPGFLGLQDITLHAELASPLVTQQSTYELRMRLFFPNQP